MRNEEVFEDFVRGKTSHSLNVFSERGGSLLVCYSYGRHFPIAVKLLDTYVFNLDKYSRSTSKHQTQLKGLLPLKLVLRDTQEIKAIIQELSGVDLPTENDLVLRDL